MSPPGLPGYWYQAIQDPPDTLPVGFLCLTRARIFWVPINFLENWDSWCVLCPKNCKVVQKIFWILFLIAHTIRMSDTITPPRPRGRPRKIPVVADTAATPAIPGKPGVLTVCEFADLLKISERSAWTIIKRERMAAVAAGRASRLPLISLLPGAGSRLKRLRESDVAAWLAAL